MSPSGNVCAADPRTDPRFCRAHTGRGGLLPPSIPSVPVGSRCSWAATAMAGSLARRRRNGVLLRRHPDLRLLPRVPPRRRLGCVIPASLTVLLTIVS
eukprot:7461966-Pyramimonas_sp.AAC.1